MRILVTVGVMLLSSSAYAQFALDMTTSQMSSANGYSTLSDLAVGERGLVRYPSFCSSNDRIFVRGTTRLERERSDYGQTWIATRQPGGLLAFEVEKGAKAGNEDLRTAILDRLIDASNIDCSKTPWGSPQLMEIGSINGKTKASEFAAP